MNAIHSPTVLLEGRGQLTLHNTDHIATGGEGALYRVKNTVVKIFTDVNKMTRENMDGKIAQLAQLNHPYIVVPKGLVWGKGGGLVGFYMSFVNGEPLARVLTNSFWKREGFTVKDASLLVSRMREVMQYAHSVGALMVDPNELNWLAVVKQNGYEPRVIDVDSWEIGSWRASVIMPSIRDPLATRFTERTDWFAWGVVTFQLYTGIHPYKGILPGFKQHDVEARMRAQASVFRSGVRLNRAVRDFNTIPGVLLDWYEAVFEKGERTIPPSPFEAGVGNARPLRTLRVVTTAQGALVYRKLFARTNDPVTTIYPAGLLRLTSGTLIDIRTGKNIAKDMEKDSEVAALNAGWMSASVENDFLKLACLNMDGSAVLCPLPIRALKIVRGAERIFALNDRGLQEVVVRRVGTRPVASVGSIWPVLPYATTWFRECGAMDALGAMHVVLPFGVKGVLIRRVDELDRMRVVDGVAYGRSVVLIAIDHTGAYHRFDILFDRAMQEYTVSARVVDSSELNAVVLPKGVTVSLEEDGELIITVPTTGVINKIQDRGITGDMILSRWGNKVVYQKDGGAWLLEMK